MCAFNYKTDRPDFFAAELNLVFISSLRNVWWSMRARKHLKQPVCADSWEGNRYDGNKFHSCDGWDQNEGASRELSSYVVCEHEWFLTHCGRVMQNHFKIPSQIVRISCEPAWDFQRSSMICWELFWDFIQVFSRSLGRRKVWTYSVQPGARNTSWKRCK